MGFANDGTLWLAAVNLIIWTGLFLYLLRIESKLDRSHAARDGDARGDER